MYSYLCRFLSFPPFFLSLVSFVFFFLSSFLFSLLTGSLLHFFSFFLRPFAPRLLHTLRFCLFFMRFSFFILVNGAIYDNTPSPPPEYINFFKPFHFLTGDQLVVPIGVSLISSWLQVIQSREWEERTKNKRTI